MGVRPSRARAGGDPSLPPGVGKRAGEVAFLLPYRLRSGRSLRVVPLVIYGLHGVTVMDVVEGPSGPVQGRLVQLPVWPKPPPSWTPVIPQHQSSGPSWWPSRRRS